MTTLFLIVALSLAGVGVYITRRDPKWGTPILVGIAIVTVLYLIWDHDQSRTQTNDPPATVTPTGQAGVPASGPQQPGTGDSDSPLSPTAMPASSSQGK